MNNVDWGYSIKSFGRKPPFSSFLPGVAGMSGIPLWCFYVNRGQAIAGFGSTDKHHSIMEFSPANTAYQRVPSVGFRTFVKIEGQVLEPFADGLGDLQVFENALALLWEDPEHRFRMTVRYFILPNAPIGALVRRIKLENLTQQTIYTEVLDGLSSIVPYGLNQHALKMMGQTAQAWMMVEGSEERLPYFRLRTSLEDTTTVAPIEDGSFGAAACDGELLTPIVDPAVLFDWDLSYASPVRFLSKSLPELHASAQRKENTLPCCFFGLSRKTEPGGFISIDSIYGLSHGRDQLRLHSENLLQVQWLNQKEKEAFKLLSPYVASIDTKTAHPLFDRYCRQSYIDNFLRGGVPYLFKADGKKQLFYLYSRKHGDLERDYNEFVVTPEYASQGNGNFRDVLQNRRSDVRFCPDAGWAPIRPFLELIQSDGYNPLVIQPTTFKWTGEDTTAVPDPVAELLKTPYTPGQLLSALEKADIADSEDLFHRILCASQPQVNAAFAEGYWVDHWIYLLDMLESYQSIFPEKLYSLLTERSLRWYESRAVVRPLRKRCVPCGTSLRQHNALDEDVKKGTAAQWLCQEDGTEIFSTAFEKLFMLCALKFASLDASGHAISMEAGKPGWYDALNGLPALFGSSTPESCELWRLLDFLTNALPQCQEALILPKEMADLSVEIARIAHLSDCSARWKEATQALENYREQTMFGVSNEQVILSAKQAEEILSALLECVADAVGSMLRSAKGVIPTYFTNLPTDWVATADGIVPTQFDHQELPPFLEGTVHALRLPLCSAEKSEWLQRLRHSSLWDDKLHMYKVSSDLTGETPELGRANAFTRGWLEHESIWLHMEYKYLLEMLKNGFYQEFFEAFSNALIPFQPPERYGRSILENSSFLASSANPDPATHGRGFVARLSGATAEFLEMWQIMFFGLKPFTLADGQLNLSLCPALPKYLVPDSLEVSATFLGHTKVTYHVPMRDDITPDMYIPSSWALISHEGTVTVVHSASLDAGYASAVRDGKYAALHVTLTNR